MTSFALVVDDVRHELSTAHWTCLRWLWRETGQRTGGFFALLIDGVWRDPAGGELAIDAPQAFDEELSRWVLALDQPVQVTSSLVEKNLLTLIQKSGIAHRVWPTRGDAHVRVGKTTHVDDAPGQIRDVPAAAALVAALQTLAAAALDGKACAIRWP